MRKRICVVAAMALLLGVAGMARAQPLSLLYNPVDGNVTLSNSSGTAFVVTGYEIDSAGGNLLPGSWNSLADQGVSGWVEGGSVSSSVLLEVNVAGQNFADGQSFNLGNAVQAGTSVQDLEFFWSNAQNQVVAGNLVVIPEPVTLSTLAAGALMLWIRRRRG